MQKILENDKMSRVKKICRHEVGHNVIAKLFGFNPGSIEMNFSPNGHSGASNCEPWRPGVSSFEILKVNLETRIKILYAGAMAEAFTDDGGVDSEYALSEWKTGGAMNDYAKIRELMHVLRNITYPETTDESAAQKELNQLDNAIFQETANLVLLNRTLIERLTDLVVSKVDFYDVNYLISVEELTDFYDKCPPVMESN